MIIMILLMSGDCHLIMKAKKPFDKISNGFSAFISAHQENHYNHINHS